MKTTTIKACDCLPRPGGRHMKGCRFRDSPFNRLYSPDAADQHAAREILATDGPCKVCGRFIHSTGNCALVREQLHDLLASQDFTTELRPYTGSDRRFKR